MAYTVDLQLNTETNQNYRAVFIIDWKNGLRLDLCACMIGNITTIRSNELHPHI